MKVKSLLALVCPIVCGMLTGCASFCGSNQPVQAEKSAQPVQAVQSVQAVRPVQPAVMMDRSLWVYDAGWFEKKRDRLWIEMNRDIERDIGTHIDFQEVKRCKDYVELYDSGRKMSVRLCDTKMEWRVDGNECWNTRYEGHWSQ